MRLEHPQHRINTRKERPSVWISRMRPDHVLVDLERMSHEERREAVSRALETGGRVVTVCRCCHDAEQLVRLVENSGFVFTKNNLPRLSNGDIARLKPQFAEYLEFTDTFFQGREEYSAFAKKILGLPVSAKISCSIPNKFAIQRVMIGLVWEKK